MPTSLQPPGAPPKLLLVEDNPVNQKIARRVLERAGYAVDVAGDGAAAVAAAARERYAAVLMDVHMPELDGLEAARRIRRLPPPACDVPIVAMSASLHPDDASLCVDAGMNDSVRKPLVERELLPALERWVRADVAARPAPSARAAAPAGRRPGGDGHGVDRSFLDALAKLAPPDNPAAIVAIVDLFLRDAPTRVTRMKDAATAGDFKTLSTVAHSLKSSSASLGARSLAALCAEIESLGSGGAAGDSKDRLGSLVTSVIEEWSRVRADMESAKTSLGARR